MATQPITGSQSTGRYHSDRILFEERHEFWWLTGPDLRRVRSLLELRCFGEKVGFEPDVAWLYAKELVRQGLRVHLRRGDKTYALNTRLRRSERSIVISRVLWLEPHLLISAEALARLHNRAAYKHSPTSDLVRGLREAVCNGGSKSLQEFGKLFVYQVTSDLYEVDWQLTAIPPDVFEAMAVAASSSKQKLPCQLVLPKGQRVGARAKQGPRRPAEDTPAVRGQLRLL